MPAKEILMRLTTYKYNAVLSSFILFTALNVLKIRLLL